MSEELLSTCCGAPPLGEFYANSGTVKEATCSACKDHAVFTPEHTEYKARLVEAAPKLLKLLKEAARLLPIEFGNKGEFLVIVEEYLVYEEIERFVAKLEGRKPAL